MAADFEGTSADRIYYSISSLSYPFTLAAWAEADATNTSLLSVGDSSGTAYARIGAGSGGGWDAFTFDGTLSDGSTGDAADTTPTNLVGVFASVSSRQLIQSGVAKAANTDTQSDFTRDRIALGITADSTPFGDWNGRGSEFAIWNVALSSGEYGALAKGFSPLFFRPASLVFYFPAIRLLTGRDYKGAVPSSLGNPLNSPHPRIIYPEWVTDEFLAAVAASPTAVSQLMLMGVG